MSDTYCSAVHLSVRAIEEIAVRHLDSSIYTMMILGLIFVGYLLTLSVPVIL